MLGALACSLLEQTPRENEDNEGCKDGAIRECVGPQGCSGITVCEDGIAGDCVCSSSGNGGTGATGGSSGTGMACEPLGDCCESPAFPASARAGCLDIVNTGDETACGQVYTAYIGSGLCSGGGMGGSTSSGGASSGGASGAASGGVSGTGVGGTSPTGGTGGIAQPTCGANFAVLSGGYVTAPGTSGCWLGFAYTSASATTTISPTGYASCGTPCMLCAAGVVPATADYSGLALIGFNTAETIDASLRSTVTPRGSALVVSFTSTMQTALRVQLLGINGETSESDRWCALIPAGAGPQISIPYSTFNTQCWEGGMGTQYLSGTPVLGVQLLVAGTNLTDVPFNFCLTGVRDS